MYTYAYERRLTTMRVDIGFTGLLAKSDSGMYARGQVWSSLSLRQKIATIKGQVHYKSVYAVVALSYISAYALLGGLALLAAYKHVAWVRLITKTLAAARAAKPETAEPRAASDRTTADSLAPTAPTVSQL
jgi:hypothetical protein